MKYILKLLTVCFLITGSAIAQENQEEDYYNKDYLRNADFIYKPNIKTVLIYKEGSELSEPVIKLNSDERLVFSFDDLDADYKKYEYTIIHCDENWNESDLMFNEYLDSFQDDYIDNYEYSINTMQPYTHYTKIIPNDIIRFRLSGNYLLKVYLDGDQEDVAFTRQFFVVEEKVNVIANVSMTSDVSKRDEMQRVRFSIITTGVNVTDPYREISVTVRQNGRWDNAITDLQPRLVTDNELHYDHSDVNVFNGGNVYRYFDIKSLKYNSFQVKNIDYSMQDGYQVYLYPDEVKRKDVFSNVQESINGKFVVKTEDMPNSDLQSEYAWVHFFLPYKTPLIQGKLYLMGELTYWQFLREAELTYNYDLGGFEGDLYLKQGFYNYHYMLLPNDARQGDVTFIEGNFFETNNEYTIYVYYHPRGARYTRLVSVTRFMAHP
ncbi:MAG: DUF5103 domain-containing protein [Bacteroidales bacterium]